MCIAQLHVGGLVAVGLDASGRYLLTVSHSGRGVYDTGTWQCVTRDIKLAYPFGGRAVGIGPLAGQTLSVLEIDYATSTLNTADLNGVFFVSYEEGVTTVDPAAT